MKMQRREKILAGVALGLVGLAGLWFLLFAGDARSYDQLSAEESKLQAKIAENQKLLKAASRDAKRLADWQRRSLPPDPTRARSLYQNWLRDLATSVNFHGFTLVSNDAGARHEQFAKISFTLRAKAKLGDLVEFMYKFYSKGLLHQIRKMDVKPTQGSRDLELNITIDALSLPAAVSKEKLPDDVAQSLQLPKLSAYRDPIVSRDFFTAYVPPEPPAPPPRREKGIDPAEFAFVTGFTEVDGAAKVWLQDRIADKTQQLGAGESFNVGNAKGNVQAIRPEGDVIIEFDGHRRLLRVGDNLRGGVDAEESQPNKPKQGNNSTAPVGDRDN